MDKLVSNFKSITKNVSIITIDFKKTKFIIDFK